MGTIRKAKVRDAESIHRLVNEYAKKGLLLPRSLHSIYETLRDFWVYEEDGKILGTCALKIFWKDLAEIRSLAVDPLSVGKGIGSALVRRALEEAKELGIDRVFTLTYRRDFFEKLGFKVVPKSSLPQKIWKDCVNCPKFPDCDEIAMEIKL